MNGYLPVFGLICVAFMCAWPLPTVLAHTQWPRQYPRLALFTWQCVGLSGGVSMIGAFITCGLVPLSMSSRNSLNTYQSFATLIHDLFVENSHTLGQILGFWHVSSICCGTLLFAHLLAHLVLTYRNLSRQRKEHKQLLELLGNQEKITDHSSALIIEDSNPTAYWMPRHFLDVSSLPIMTRGLLNALTPEQIQAVVDHEKAHTIVRHDLLTWVFSSWKSALTWLPTSHQAYNDVTKLTELDADDYALKTTTTENLLDALDLMAKYQSPSAKTELIYDRITRLKNHRPVLPKMTQGLIIISSIILALVPFIIFSITLK